MKSIFECRSESDLGEAAELLLTDFKNEKIFAFYGEMAAGKTTFIRAICSFLRTTDHVSSPTYSLVNEYERLDGGNIYHFDFYRIKDLDEAIAIGTDEYFSSGNICLIEWPEKISALLPARFVKVNLLPLDDMRLISMELNG